MPVPPARSLSAAPASRSDLNPSVIPAGTQSRSSSGHWHYAHYYYAQVAYRDTPERWGKYRQKVFRMILDQQEPTGGWTEGWVGPIYTTALNLAILQLDAGALPIYQR